MSRPHLLVLGGTTESRRLVTHLEAQGSDWEVTTSLAGRVSRPGELPGRVRSGGFGGVGGLVDWLREHEVRAVVDATHPFAATMTNHAAQACSATGTPLLRLERPGWTPVPGDDWCEVDTVAEAAALADRLGRCLLVTTGRQEASAFADVTAHCLLRSIEPPQGPLPSSHDLLLERGPFTVASERALISDRGVDVLVTKNSGGDATAAKLEAARDAGIPVVMVRRPAPPEALRVVTTVADAVRWLAGAAQRPNGAS